MSLDSKVLDDRVGVISFKLVGEKVYFRRKEFDTIMGLRFRPWHTV